MQVAVTKCVTRKAPRAALPPLAPSTTRALAARTGRHHSAKPSEKTNLFAMNPGADRPLQSRLLVRARPATTEKPRLPGWSARCHGIFFAYKDYGFRYGAPISLSRIAVLATGAGSVTTEIDFQKRPCSNLVPALERGSQTGSRYFWRSPYRSPEIEV